MAKGKCTRWVLMAGLTAGMCLTAEAQSLLQAYCIGCHNQKAKTAGVALDHVNFARVGADAALWERVLHKVRRGEMPPPGLPRPDAKTYDAVADPKIVIAVGACAISGGVFAESPETTGIPSSIPVDLWIPGCPPHPLTILDGLLRLLGKEGLDARAKGL